MTGRFSNARRVFAHSKSPAFSIQEKTNMQTAFALVAAITVNAFATGAVAQPTDYPILYGSFWTVVQEMTPPKRVIGQHWMRLT